MKVFFAVNDNYGNLKSVILGLQQAEYIKGVFYETVKRVSLELYRTGKEYR
jgi:hypothetical protein